MEFFFKYKIIIARSLGVVMLLVGFAIHFWVTPKEGLSQNEMAAANLARMERQVKGSGATKASTKKDDTKFLDKLKETQEKQMRYLTILAMVLGVAFLGYSFMPKKD